MDDPLPLILALMSLLAFVIALLPAPQPTPPVKAQRRKRR